MSSVKMKFVVSPSSKDISNGLKSLDLRLFNWRSTKVSAAAGYDPQKEAVSLTRKSVMQEFDNEAHHTPQGGWDPWKKVTKFGNREPPNKILERSGKLRDAWDGGQGGFKTMLKREVIVGVNHSRVKYADIQRDGGLIPVTNKMRAFVYMNFKVWFPRTKKNVMIPARKHATSNPTLVGWLTKNYTDAYIRYAEKVLSGGK